MKFQWTNMLRYCNAQPLLISLVSRYLNHRNPWKKNCGSEVRRAQVHLFFMIFRLTLITVKIRFWTFTAASQFLRQHIVTLLGKKDWRKLSLPYQWYTFTLSNKGFSYLCHGTWQQLSENYQGDIPFLLKWNANLSKLLSLIMLCPAYGPGLNGLHGILRELV